MISMKGQVDFESCCPRLFQGPLDKAEAELLGRAFAVLADPARLRLLSLLASRPSGEACVCHLTDPLGLSQPTVSHHLKVLYLAGVLAREQRGKWVYYRILPRRLEVLREALSLPAATKTPTGH